MRTGIFLMIWIVLFQCVPSRTTPQVQFNKERSDSLDFVTFKLDTNKRWGKKFSSFKPIDLTSQEFKRLEAVSGKCFYDDSTTFETRLFKTIDLSEYKKQYVPMANSKGERVVWVNCLCKQAISSIGDIWLEDVVSVHDGGKCYLNFKINLDKDYCFDLYIN